MAPSLNAVAHPRLFLPNVGFSSLQAQIRDDLPSKRIAECLRRKAEIFCKLPVNQRVLNGTRLLSVARSCLERILPLAMMARLDGNEHYARRALDEMLAAAAFTDWNPAHFLDTGELTFALGTGYDWLYDLLTGQERDTIATAIVEKGLQASFHEPAYWWVNSPYNWNQVCHAGLCVGALAVAEREPELAERILSRAVANVPKSDAEYEPDGAYVEGTMYWGYGTVFQIALATALKSATGSDHGLADNAGFLASARYIRQMEGPSGKYFNYSDSYEKRDFQPPLLWFAQRLSDPALAEQELRDLDRFLTGYEAMESHLGYRLTTLGLVWRRVPEKPETGISLPCHWHGRGQTPVAVHRSAWQDPQATFVAIKGGSPSAPHGHMDAGTFVLEAGGVRWAADLGGESYLGLEEASVDLWNSKQSGGAGPCSGWAARVITY